MAPITVVTTLAILAAVVWVVIKSPRPNSLAEEERELHEYFRKRDAAERRGERFPP